MCSCPALADNSREEGRFGGREEGRKDRSEKQEERKEMEKGAGGGHSTGMVDHPWMSGGVHGVTHAPRLAIDQEQAAL